MVTVHGPPVLEFGASHPGGLPLLAPVVIGADTDVVNDTPGTRTFGAIHLLGYVAVTVATVPTGAFGQAHTAKLVAPSYFPTAARSAGALTVKSKSAIETLAPFGPRGHPFPDASLRSIDTALHSPTASTFRVIETVAVNGSPFCARASAKTRRCGSSGSITSAVRIRAPLCDQGNFSTLRYRMYIPCRSSAGLSKSCTAIVPGGGAGRMTGGAPKIGNMPGGTVPGLYVASLASDASMISRVITIARRGIVGPESTPPVPPTPCIPTPIGRSYEPAVSNEIGPIALPNANSKPVAALRCVPKEVSSVPGGEIIAS